MATARTKANTTRRNGGRLSRPQTRSASSGTEITESSEEYLAAIQRLIEEKGYARVSDIAQALAFSRPSVSIMVQRLARHGYLKYERYRGLTVTEKGRRVAREIRGRHATLGRFFALLGLTRREVSANVEGMGHRATPSLLSRLERVASYWEGHPSQLRQALAAPEAERKTRAPVSASKA
jgi:Mn-dependent DtxR family transcriptional regulator